MNTRDLTSALINKIKEYPLQDFNIMEVCGTHTQNISKLGIREIFYPKIKFISGPGCPVCVTSKGYIDAAINLSNKENVIITTFGDLMKVSGSSQDLIRQRAKGKKIQIVYSPLDALKIAKENKKFEVVFLAVGFETTAPLIALTIKIAKKEAVDNFSILSGLKVMEPILHKILNDKSHKIQGIICPGHVAVIKGAKYFKFIAEEYNVSTVISGFESLDIISAIYFLIRQKDMQKKQIKNLYKTCVTQSGNVFANTIMDEVFYHEDCVWRGIGEIYKSGLNLNSKYKEFNALKKFDLNIEEKNDDCCVCSEIILGKKFPCNCKFFGRECTPQDPVGPCMVSSEGACSIYYRYEGGKHYE